MVAGPRMEREGERESSYTTAIVVKDCLRGGDM